MDSKFMNLIHMIPKTDVKTWAEMESELFAASLAPTMNGFRYAAPSVFVPHQMINIISWAFEL